MTTARDTRVVVLAPTAKDYELVCAQLERRDIDCTPCSTLEAVCAALDEGAGVLMIAEEVLARPQALVHWIEHQPPWSDLPVLVLARPGADSRVLAAACGRLGNVTILERPARIATLVSAVQSALRARLRQYQIREHLAERARTEEVLRANDRRKDEFLAILAHELRNPLAPISNALHILKLSRSDDARTATVGQMMERQVGNLKRLVDDLLEVSRVTRGDVELRRERIELASVIRTAIEASQPLIDGSNHQFEAALPPQSIQLQADPVRLAQVVSNILNNAAKYTAPGGRIALTVTREGDQAVISVKDNGMGIPLEEQPRIFELFMQVDRNRNRAQGGLGIGLTLVKRLVELHDGRTEVQSDGNGKGSEFKVYLPVIDTRAAAATAADATEPDLSHLNILIADDNADAADSLGLLLERLGATLRITYGGATALEALDLDRMNVAILDLGMHDVDGLKVARRIRELEGSNRENKMLLIALTGWGQARDISATEDAGFDHHLIKPVDFGLLLKHLGWRAAQVAK